MSGRGDTLENLPPAIVARVSKEIQHLYKK
jgi:hypothetical protein